MESGACNGAPRFRDHCHAVPPPRREPRSMVLATEPAAAFRALYELGFAAAAPGGTLSLDPRGAAIVDGFRKVGRNVKTAVRRVFVLGSKGAGKVRDADAAFAAAMAAIGTRARASAPFADDDAPAFPARGRPWRPRARGPHRRWRHLHRRRWPGRKHGSGTCADIQGDPLRVPGPTGGIVSSRRRCGGRSAGGGAQCPGGSPSRYAGLH